MQDNEIPPGRSRGYHHDHAEESVYHSTSFVRIYSTVHVAFSTETNANLCHDGYNRHMAADEMRDIGADKWSDEIWGLSGPSEISNQQTNKLTKLIFYFGRDDHWVAEKTRDEIIRAKSPKSDASGLNNRGPTMMVCDDGIIHGFCVGKCYIPLCCENPHN